MKNSIWHCLLLATILLCSAGMFNSQLVAAAQDGTASHRRLKLPQNSPTQPQEQLARLLQYFQSLKGEQAPSAKGQNQAAEDDQTLNKLKQALGPELGGMLDQLPPNTARNAMKDPAIRNQVRQMLQQFSKDGKLPDFIDQPSKNSSQLKPKQSTQDQPADNDNQNQQRAGRDSNQLRARQSGDRRPNAPDASLKNAQDRLSDLIEQLRQKRGIPSGEQSSSQDETDPTVPRSNSDQRPTQETNGKQPKETNRNSPMTQSEWEEQLRELMQKQRDSVRKNRGNQNETKPPSVPSTNSVRPNPRDGGRYQATQGMDNSKRNNASLDGTRSSPQQAPDLARPTARGNESATGRDNNSIQRREEPTGAKTSSAPSMSEFLEQMKDVPTPDLSDLGVDLSASSQGKEKGSQGKMSGNLLADAMNQMNPQQLREQAKKALQDEGLRKTLKDILKDAKQTAKQDLASGGGPGDIIADVAAATGMEDTVLEALGGMTEELVEIAKDAKFQSGTSKDRSADVKPDGRQPDQSSSSTTNANDSSDSQQDKSVFSQFTESASNAIKNFSQTPEPPAGGSSGSDVGGGNFSALIFGLVLIVALIGCLIVGTKLRPATEVQNPDKVLAILLQQGIRTKEDVIKAFHQFALKPPHETQNWWTHSRVVDTVVHQYPQHSTRIQILASLYEQARYFPAETEFTDAQIQQAADAVKTVGVA